MYCINCGKKISECAKWCTYCGTKVQSSCEHKLDQENFKSTKKKNIVPVVALILAFVYPIIGFVLGIIGISESKYNNGKGKSLSIAAIVLSIVVTVLSIIIVIYLVWQDFEYYDSDFKYGGEALSLLIKIK